MKVLASGAEFAQAGERLQLASVIETATVSTMATSNACFARLLSAAAAGTPAPGR